MKLSLAPNAEPNLVLNSVSCPVLSFPECFQPQSSVSYPYLIKPHDFGAKLSFMPCWSPVYFFPPVFLKSHPLPMVQWWPYVTTKQGLLVPSLFPPLGFQENEMEIFCYLFQ
jgi:hypothetical protein